MTKYDILIIGTGAGGGTLAQALAPSGKKILIIDRGDYIPREKANWNPRSMFVEAKYKTTEKWQDKDGKDFGPGMYYCVGGNTKVYGAALLRLREKDFQEVQHHGGISPAWPLQYDDFQPYYLEAENLFQVHGKRGSDPTEPKESAPYPFPPLKHEEPLKHIYEKLQTLGHKPFPLPLGLRLNEQDRKKSLCIRCDTCDGYPCLVDAKADSDTTCIRPALTFPNVTLLTNTKAIRLETDPSGKTVQAVIVEREGKQERLTADRYVVSCGAVNSAALLLKSANSSHPNGLANSSGQLGRNYMCHINSIVLSLHKERNRSNYQKTFAINDFYWNAPDWEYPLGHIQLLGNVKKEMLEAGAPFVPSFVLQKMVDHTVGWWVSSEDLPSPENRVLVNSDGRISLHYTPNNQEGHKRLIKKLEHLIRKVEPSKFLVARLPLLTKRMPIGAVAHQVGTCRFGKDPKTSVLDLNCKTHDIDNLYVVDGSFFPSSSGVNPALTIMANALRVSKELL